MDRDSPQFRELAKLVGPQPDEIYELALRVCYASCKSLKLRQQFAPEGYQSAKANYMNQGKHFGMHLDELRRVALAAREVAAYTNATEKLDAIQGVLKEICLASAGRAIPLTPYDVMRRLAAGFL